MLLLSPAGNLITTWIITGCVAFILMMCMLFIGHATADTVQKDGQVRRNLYLFCGLLATWVGFSLALSSNGYLSVTLVVFATVLPIVVGTLLSFTPFLRDVIARIPTHWLVFLQFYRVVGLIFIFPYYTSGLLTRGFAFNAGIGDVLTGVLAIPVGYILLRGSRYSRMVLVGWSIIGIGDLGLAISSAIFLGFSAGEPVLYPVSLIPLYAGPPFGILIHIITMRSFWLRNPSSDPVPSRPVSSVPSPQ